VERVSTLSLLDAAAEAPARLALERSGKRYTFADLARRVARRQTDLMAALGGAGAGELVALETAHVPSAIETLLALMQLGVPFVPLHDRFTPGEKLAILEQHPVRCLLEPLPEGGVRRQTLRAQTDARLPADTLAAIATSGTTASPRLAVLSRNAFVASARASARNLGWRDDDRWLLCLPLAHVGGLSIVTRCLLARRAIVLPDPASAIAGSAGSPRV
jgi:O-succinylbenzoic acid--CoA ligase